MARFAAGITIVPQFDSSQLSIKAAMSLSSETTAAMDTNVWHELINGNGKFPMPRIALIVRRVSGQVTPSSAITTPVLDLRKANTARVARYRNCNLVQLQYWVH